MDKKRKKIENVTYEQLRLMVHQVFSKYPIEKINRYDVTPATFESIAKIYNLEFVYEDFNELLALNTDDEQLYNKLFGKYRFNSGQVIIITDEFIKERTFVKVDCDHLYDFVCDFYPSTCNMTLFQPQDIVFWGAEQKMVTVVHHEGYYAHMMYV